MSIGAAVKRRFLGLAFYPHGGDVSNALGFPPQSDDVGDREMLATNKAYTALYTDPDLDRVIELAEVFIYGVHAAHRVGSPAFDRPTQEDFVAFYYAAKGTLASIPRQAGS